VYAFSAPRDENAAMKKLPIIFTVIGFICLAVSITRKPPLPQNQISNNTVENPVGFEINDTLLAAVRFSTLARNTVSGPVGIAVPSR